MNEDRQREMNLRKILQSLSYRVAYKDVDFLMQPELRAARMELELLKPELYFQRNNIRSTVVLFGSTRIIEPAAAGEQLERARARLAETPDDARRQRAVARAEDWALADSVGAMVRHVLTRSCRGVTPSVLRRWAGTYSTT